MGDSKEAAKLKLEKEVAAAKAEARKKEQKLKKRLEEKVAKESSKIRKHHRAKAKEILLTKWGEMKRKLKLKTVICDTSEETEAAKLKRKLKMVKATLSKIQKSHSERRDKLKRKTLEERRSKRWAKDQMKTRLKEYEHATELKEKATVKQAEDAAKEKVEAAEKSAEEEKTIAKANEKA